MWEQPPEADQGLIVQGEADGGKGSYCVEHLSSSLETRKKKKGFIAAMRDEYGQSPDCGHSNQGCHRLTIIAISGDEQEKFSH